MIGADRFIGNKDAAIVQLHTNQRYNRGFSDVDMWNFDIFLADVIVVGCQYHIDHASTLPAHMDKQQWRETLIAIRDGFMVRDESGAPIPPKSAWKLLRKNFRYLWD